MCGYYTFYTLRRKVVRVHVNIWLSRCWKMCCKKCVLYALNLYLAAFLQVQERSLYSANAVNNFEWVCLVGCGMVLKKIALCMSVFLLVSVFISYFFFQNVASVCNCDAMKVHVCFWFMCGEFVEAADGVVLICVHLSFSVVGVTPRN